MTTQKHSFCCTAASGCLQIVADSPESSPILGALQRAIVNNNKKYNGWLDARDPPMR